MKFLFLLVKMLCSHSATEKEIQRNHSESNIVITFMPMMTVCTCVMHLHIQSIVYPLERLFSLHSGPGMYEGETTK